MIQLSRLPRCYTRAEGDTSTGPKSSYRKVGTVRTLRTITGGPLRRLEDLAAGLRRKTVRCPASDEARESGALASRDCFPNARRRSSECQGRPPRRCHDQDRPHRSQNLASIKVRRGPDAERPWAIQKSAACRPLSDTRGSGTLTTGGKAARRSHPGRP